MSPDPLTDFDLGTGPFSACKEFCNSLGVFSPDKVLKSHLEKPCQVAPQAMCPPTFIMLPTSLVADAHTNMVIFLPHNLTIQG